MAQIIERSGLSSADFRTQIAADLQTLFDFVKFEDEKLYITDSLYIAPNANMAIGNGNGITFNMQLGSSNGNNYRLVKSENGDVAIFTGTSTLIDNLGFKLAIVKVKNAITNEESYGIFANTVGGSSGASNNLGQMMLFTEDVTNNVEIVTVSSNPNSLTSYTNFSYGAKTSAAMTVLCEAFSHQSQCTTVNFRIMLVTPRPYNGDCLINGKKYYCITYLAMLDE